VDVSHIEWGPKVGDHVENLCFKPGNR